MNLTPKVGKWPQRVVIDESNSNHRIWWSENLERWHWVLVWEDGCSYGTHIHSGIADSKHQARADLVKTIEWIEETWPSYKYFEGV